MAGKDDPIDAAERLENALERIAALAARRTTDAPANPAADTADLARQLDALIDRLRAGLGDEPEAG